MSEDTVISEISSADVYAESINELRLLRSLRRIMRAADIYSEELKRSEHITTVQLIVLLTVAGRESVALPVLSEAVDLSQATVKAIVEQLQQRQLLERVSDPDAGLPGLQVMLTPAGYSLVQRAPLPLQWLLLRGFRDLPETEQAFITLALERLVRLLGASYVDASAILDLAPMKSSTRPPPQREHVR